MLRAFLITCLSTAALQAGEFAVLQTGFRVAATHHETADGRVKLFTATGVMEFEAGQIASFEEEEYVPPPPAPPKPAAAPAPAVGPAPPKTPRDLVQLAALAQGLPPEFLHSVAAAESAYRADAISSKGAIGIMQLMPSTAAALHADAHNPEQNVDAGARLLRELLIKYQDRPNQVQLALAAYNAGPGAVDRYHGVPPYRETQAYVQKIVRDYLKKTKKNSHDAVAGTSN